jgi:hypothetical protein
MKTFKEAMVLIGLWILALGVLFTVLAMMTIN